jgi:hypothetical protein
VLARRRGGGTDDRRGVGEHRQRADLHRAPGPGIVDLGGAPVLDRLRVLQVLGRGEEGVAADVLGQEHVEPLVEGPLAHGLGQQLTDPLELGPRREHVGHVGQAGLVEQVLEAERPQPVAEQVGLAAAHLDPAPVGRARGHERQVHHPEDPARVVGLVHAVAVPAHHVERDQRVEQAGVDPLALAGAPPGVQRGQQPLDGEHGGAVRRDGRRGEDRPVAIAVQRGHAPGARGHDALVARQVAQRAALAEARDGDADDARVHRGEVVVAEAQGLDGAGPPVVEDAVGRRGEVEQLLPPGRCAQVEGHAALAPVPDQRGRVAGERTTAGWHDLDHVGAVVGQDHAGQRTGHPPAEVEHAQVVERRGHRGSLLVP